MTEFEPALYTPRTNGKAERCIQTLCWEWASLQAAKRTGSCLPAH